MNNLVLRLLEGNDRYLKNKTSHGDISLDKRKETANNGQHPFAVIIACSDSRVMPEAIFDCGIGDLFVIRVAGNVIGEHELGSIQYATEHLNCQLVVVLAHTQCGAIASALGGHGGGYVNYLLNPIHQAIGEEKDPQKASKINALAGVKTIKESLKLKSFETIAMLYDIANGKVEIL